MHMYKSSYKDNTHAYIYNHTYDYTHINTYKVNYTP